MEKTREQDINPEEAIAGVFRFMQDLFTDFYGIKLNIIELVDLKKICAQVYDEYIKSNERLDCLTETEDRFLREFFDMSYDDRVEIFKTNQEVKDYFRILHDRKNLI